MKKCPLCGAESVILDTATGTVVCTSCGYVLEENVVDVSGGTGYREDVTAVQQSRTRYKPIDVDYSRLIDDEMSRRRRKLERLANVRHATDISILTSVIERIRLDTVDGITRILKLLEEKGGLKKRSSRMKLAVAHALYEYVNGRYPNLRELASLYSVNELNLKRAFRRLIRSGLDREIEKTIKAETWLLS
ncbi:hypothetical protein Pyrfu_0205 [Pyrolobus fumarii 1A]|uniref:TFIIB-type domain-containing protein n=1 Tax=Pyrolobus fumarii (strain DSM 11204 / 1A) TaxID=694429 RepID=G0EEW3_PYRF1|nr:TFIIB-type zinc ribbon-containing protein [Pyrolobus fumarii]AEM38077.1 hypothetical protein Pyrfu_0205 [Pyrolobus fumarii 1A]